MAQIALTAPADVRQFADDINNELLSLKSRMASPMPLFQCKVATLPSVSKYRHGLVFVTDSSKGAVPAYSDGTHWRFFSNDAIVS